MDIQQKCLLTDQRNIRDLEKYPPAPVKQVWTKLQTKNIIKQVIIIQCLNRC